MKTLTADQSSAIAKVLQDAFKKGVEDTVEMSDVKQAAETLGYEAKKAAESRFQPSGLGKAPTGSFAKIAQAAWELAWAMGAASVKKDDTKKATSLDPIAARVAHRFAKGK